MSKPSIKLIVLIKRKNTISRESFKSHYETIHVPLVLSITQSFSKYVRNYVGEASALHPAGMAAGYDAVTECWFDTAQDYVEFREDLQREREGRARISVDEENFMERGATQMFMVTECGGVVGRRDDGRSKLAKL